MLSYLLLCLLPQNTLLETANSTLQELLGLVDLHRRCRRNHRLKNKNLFTTTGHQTTSNGTSPIIALKLAMWTNFM